MKNIFKNEVFAWVPVLVIVVVGLIGGGYYLGTKSKTEAIEKPVDSQVSNNSILTEAQIKNSTLLFNGFSVALKNGVHIPEIKQDEAMGPTAVNPDDTFELTIDKTAFGDLDGDGTSDAAAVLRSLALGANGIMKGVVVFRNVNEKPIFIDYHDISTTNQIAVDSIVIKDGYIIISATEYSQNRRDGKPFSERYVIEGSTIVKK